MGAPPVKMSDTTTRIVRRVDDLVRVLLSSFPEQEVSAKLLVFFGQIW